MTDSDPSQQRAADSEPRLRAELLGKLLAAQSELEAQIAELRRTGSAEERSLAAQCGEQLGLLQALRSGLSTARGGELALMKADVRAATTGTAGLVQQVRTAMGSGAADSPELMAATAATRRELAGLQADLFERRIFDPFLRFASKEEEEAYRRREEETRRYIDQQLAAKTPEGALNAAGAVTGQMLDAHAHGAGDSPEFLPRWNRLVATTRKQREAMRAEGRSTAEFDRNLADSVRRYLRSKGLSEAEIEAKLAVAGDPLEVVRGYIGSEREARELDDALGANQRVSTIAEERPSTMAVVTGSTQATARSAVQAPSVDDVMASFRAAGVVTDPASQAGLSLAPVPGKSPEIAQR